MEKVYVKWALGCLFVLSLCFILGGSLIVIDGKRHGVGDRIDMGWITCGFGVVVLLVWRALKALAKKIFEKGD